MSLLNWIRTQAAQPTKQKQKQKKREGKKGKCILHLGYSYTNLKESFPLSLFNNYPFHRNTRGTLRDSSAIDCSHLNSGEAVCQRDRCQTPVRTTCVGVGKCICVVQWELPRPISCIHHQTPVTVWSPVNSMVFTHSGSVSTLLYELLTFTWCPHPFVFPLRWEVGDVNHK